MANSEQQTAKHNQPKTFALIGAAGYVAPRHMKAIKDTGNILVAALDKSDSVGVIDSYFPDAAFFTEFERFDRHLEKIKRHGRKIDYLVVCSPNYLHDAHIRFGLRHGADVICEKPVVLNPWNIDALQQIEKETGKRVFNILQLRLHPSIKKLKKTISSSPGKFYNGELTYITSRGLWYYASWKGDESKSGGIATNIGVHFFDVLSWIFGEVLENQVHLHTHDRAAGLLKFRQAKIKWFLGINKELLPELARKNGKKTYRVLSIGNQEADFSSGFDTLHTESYIQILQGRGFSLTETFDSIQVVHEIRSKKTMEDPEEGHQLSNNPVSTHPFHQTSTIFVKKNSKS